MLPSLANAPSFAIQSSFQRRDSWWEKENLIRGSDSNSFVSDPKDLIPAPQRIEMSDDGTPSLRGWFLKEKRDNFKRRQSILPGANTNRRWFTIERIPTGKRGGSASGPAEEWALCYYRKSSSSAEDRCGWLFLNDVLSLVQDLPNRWILVEHPTRILRMQSPTPAQHRVWFSTLSKCCKNVRRRPGTSLSPTSAPPPGEKRPSLPYFSEDSVRKAKKNSLKDAKPIASTPKDELDFLRQITGGGSGESGEVSRSSFDESSSSSTVEDQIREEIQVEHKPANWKEDPGQEKESRPIGTARHGNTKEPGTAMPPDLGAESGGATASKTSPPESEEKAEVEPLSFNGPGLEGTRGAGGPTPAGTTDNFHANELSKALSLKEDRRLSNKDLPKSNSFSSYSRQISRSSSYRLHFGNEDDDEVVPDDDFLNDDWDA